MKIWDILKEENLDAYVKLINKKEFIYNDGPEYYIVKKNKLNRIGLFNAEGYEDLFLMSDIMEMNFKIINKQEIKPKFEIGQQVQVYWGIRNGVGKKTGDILKKNEHCRLASGKVAVLTISGIDEGWICEPIYKVKENDLDWSESMLETIF